MSGQQHAPAALYPRERPGTHFTGGWVGPRAGLDGQKSRPHWDSIPNHPAHSQSLYRLSYPAHTFSIVPFVNTTVVSVVTYCSRFHHDCHKYFTHEGLYPEYWTFLSSNCHLNDLFYFIFSCFIAIVTTTTTTNTTTTTSNTMILIFTVVSLTCVIVDVML